MSRSRRWSSANADLRRRTQVPAPAISEIEQSLLRQLSPGSFKPLTGLKGTHDKAMREWVSSVTRGGLIGVRLRLFQVPLV